jgi:NAD(P)-dependent dehydrogenase (short-subunit alcohol dehydrogenase family)
MEIQSKVWYVTGAAEGLGLNLVKQLLAAGYKVAAASANVDDLQNALGDASSDFLPLQVNLSREESVIASLQMTADTFGRIDVVVNTADDRLTGNFEELSDKEARANFEINVFGMMNIIRNTMPHFRKQQSGHIFNMSSIAGFNGNYPGLSIYCATKFAVAGLSESLAAEARPFGIKVTIVLPEQFRTSIDHPQDKTISVHQPTEPAHTAALMISVAAAEEPPLYLFIGKTARQAANEKMQSLKNDMCLWQNA